MEQSWFLSRPLLARSALPRRQGGGGEAGILLGQGSGAGGPPSALLSPELVTLSSVGRKSHNGGGRPRNDIFPRVRLGSQQPCLQILGHGYRSVVDYVLEKSHRFNPQNIQFKGPQEKGAEVDHCLRPWKAVARRSRPN